MAIAIWTESKSELSFEEFIEELSRTNIDIKSTTVLNSVQEYVYDDHKDPVIDKIIHHATSIAVTYDWLQEDEE